ncbi:glycosyltransferase family A protein [Brachybacterium paraconglomeratum]|uniref:glycosyltransferase family A protein n=1 Tax=Brachybacterium paraconglomeratum TaxID=173362 RepID=UPI003FD33AA7
MRRQDTVVVGLATYRRPALLAGLLPRLLEQIEAAAEDLAEDARLGIVVVDNDPDGSAKAVVDGVGDQRIRYVIEPSPGISSARNRVLDEAADADVLVFLDDDETPHAQWLVHLLKTHREHDADAVCGPVHAVFDGGEDPWIAAGGYYLGQRREGMRTGEVLGRAATNNLLLDLAEVRRIGLRFDARFGASGGEDSLFTGQLTASGGRLVLCAEAVVDDLVPRERNRRGVNLARVRAQAGTHVRVEQELARTRGERLRGTGRWAVIGSGQVLKGGALVLGGRVTGDLRRRAQGELRVARGLGALGGCLGAVASPYARTDGVSGGGVGA